MSRKERSSLFVFHMNCDSLKVLKGWKHYFQWPDCLAVVTHVIWRNARREEEKTVFDLSNIGGCWKEDWHKGPRVHSFLSLPQYFTSFLYLISLSLAHVLDALKSAKLQACWQWAVLHSSCMNSVSEWISPSGKKRWKIVQLSSCTDEEGRAQWAWNNKMDFPLLGG